MEFVFFIFAIIILVEQVLHPEFILIKQIITSAIVILLAAFFDMFVLKDKHVRRFLDRGVLFCLISIAVQNSKFFDNPAVLYSICVLALFAHVVIAFAKK